jgi:hypothetical protein
MPLRPPGVGTRNISASTAGLSVDSCIGASVFNARRMGRLCDRTAAGPILRPWIDWLSDLEFQ